MFWHILLICDIFFVIDFFLFSIYPPPITIIAKVARGRLEKYNTY